ncbi:hypothetical protein [Streptomyces erythrochromogenes]|uniref:hypothetical protein n=1 Tax=Streptomyces erythrochromogenes TaxID=285574 RepID=UPI00225738E1|nr:hypothetical protein [Streptomyces erythrochromogenes]MCX5587540.1 hypothetical protein [Streptomyces erythrochromogenes]
MVLHGDPFWAVDDRGQAVTAARSAGKAQSWDDFKKATFGTRTEVIEGVTVPVPSDIPLNFTTQFNGLSEESDIAEFGDAVATLYGDGVFEQWVEHGMGALGLLTALMWGYMQGNGQDVSFADAYKIVTSDDPGKAAVAVTGNRAARRSQSRATGGRSSRTSAASTASPRTRSRT